jgi:hypothetical protein
MHQRFFGLPSYWLKTGNNKKWSKKRKRGIATYCPKKNDGFFQEHFLFKGSMLLSQFSAIFDNFRQKIRVFLKSQCYDQLISKFGFVLRQKRQFFR